MTNQQNLLEEYRYAIDSSSIVSKTTPKGIITYVNDLFCQTSGYSKEELLGKSHSIVRHPDMPKEAFAQMWETILGKKTWQGTVKNKKKDGGFYIVDARIIPILDAEGTIIEFMAIRHDITQIYLQQQMIDEERILSQTILDEQTNIVSFQTKEGGLLNVNRHFFTIFPYESLEDFHKKHFCIGELFLKEQGYLYTTNERHWLDATIQNQNNNCTVKMVDKQGEERIFIVTTKSIMQHGKQFYVSTFSDTTLMQKAIDAAHMANQAKSNFLASMSHEIRTPLNGVLGFVSLLGATSLDKTQHEYTEIIRSSAENLLSIINDILDFSKVESGVFGLEMIPFNPVKEFEGTIELYAAKALEKEICFDIFVDPTLPSSIVGDPLRIKQVLGNLIGNAIKFTPNNGYVNVVIEALSLTPELITLRFSVKDGGIGIAPENIASIFTPFAQADNSISRQFGGTGLGLSISKGFVEKMGGTIHVESTLGEGSEFSFDITFQYSPSLSSTATHSYPKTVGIFLANESLARYMQTLIRYLKAFGIGYEKIENMVTLDRKGCDTVFILTTGHDTIRVNNSESLRIVTIMPKNAPFHLPFKESAIIHLPLNGSKVFDAIIEPLEIKKSHATPQETQQLNGEILVAEDNSVNQQLITIILKQFGLNVTIANNGQEAFDYVCSRPFDLIFMDIHMPVMNGIDATKNIIAYEHAHDKAHTPIIALTANAIQGDKERFLAEGMDGYLSKPIVRSELDAILYSYLGQPKLPTPSQAEEKESTSSPLFDPQKTSELLGLDVPTIMMLATDFIDNISTDLKELIHAIELNNIRSIEEVGHKIKGGAGNLRIDAISQKAGIIESAAREGKEIDFTGEFFDLLSFVEELKKEVSPS